MNTGSRDERQMLNDIREAAFALKQIAAELKAIREQLIHEAEQKAV